MGQATSGEGRLRGGQIVRFGAFELHLDTGELRKHGVRVRLQGKPFHILSALTEEPGHVVTREELRTRLWPADTFVDFESGLNTAVNRLRIALGDSAENPIYIETLARLGYRFIAPVVVSSAAQRLEDIQPSRLELEPTVSALETVPSTLSTLPKRFSLPARRWTTIASLVILVMAVAVAAVFFPISRLRPAPSFHQVTFRKGSVANARFTPDGGNVSYSAEWDGRASRVFLADLVNPEARDLGFEDAWLASLSPTGEMAVFVRPKDTRKSALERVPLHGGAPRLVSDRAKDADWAPDGTLCLVTDQNAIWSVEFPPGRKIYSSNGWITSPRVSPHGNDVAFLEHPVIGDDAGQVVVVNSSGKARVLSSGWASALGLAWHPSGEVWFTATRSGANRALMAVDLGGRVRQIAAVPGDLQLKDIAASGKVLIAQTTQHVTMFLGNLDERSERDISWLDWSRAVAITPDGKDVLFDESGEGGGKQYSVYLYRTDARSPERLGEGRAMDLSADGQWALTQSADDATKLSLISVNTAQPKPVFRDGLSYRWAKFFPDGKEIVAGGAYPNQNLGIYRQTLPDGRPVPLKLGLNFENAIIDEKGSIAVGCDGSQIVVLDLSSGNTRFVKTPQCVSPEAFVDAQTVLTRYYDGGLIELNLLNLTTGQTTPYRRYAPPDMPGSSHMLPMYIAKDLQTFVYSRMQSLSNLFVVSGWR